MSSIHLPRLVVFCLCIYLASLANAEPIPGLSTKNDLLDNGFERGLFDGITGITDTLKGLADEMKKVAEKVPGLNKVTGRSEDRQAAEVAGAVAEAIAGPVFDTLNTLSESDYSTDEVVCFWNSWKDRDQRAKMMKTFRNGRFSHVRRTWGFKNGKWYCAYKPEALKKIGWALGN